MEHPIKMDDLGYHYFRKHPSVHQDTSLALLVLRPFFPKITFIKGSKVGSHSGSVDPSVLLFPRQFLKRDVLGRDFFGMERWNGGGMGGWMGRRLYVFFFWDAFERYTTPEMTSMTMENSKHLGRCISHEKLGDFPASHVDLVGGCFPTPLKNINPKWVHLPQIGVKIQKMNPPPSHPLPKLSCQNFELFLQNVVKLNGLLNFPTNQISPIFNRHVDFIIGCILLCFYDPTPLLFYDTNSLSGPTDPR